MFRIFLLFILVYLVVRWFNRMMYSPDSYSSENDNYRSQQTNNDGKVTVDKNIKSGKIISRDVGEYVDYEEVK